MNAKVTRLQTAAIKGTRLRSVEQVTLSRSGAAGDRRFFLVDNLGRMLNGKVLGMLHTVSADFDESSGRLSLEFDDGRVVDGAVGDGGNVETTAYGEFRMGQLVDGPWAEALSTLCRRQLRLVRTESAVDRGTRGAVSLVSGGSLRRLAEQAQTESVDARRFRMLIGVDGVEPHAEDDWVGRKAHVGESLLQFEGHVGRCVITHRDPETGEKTLPTLELLRAYRDDGASTEPMAFGIYGRVLQGGIVRIGDGVELA
jgi:MOSC domain-containing protein